MQAIEVNICKVYFLNPKHISLTLVDFLAFELTMNRWSHPLVPLQISKIICLNTLRIYIFLLLTHYWRQVSDQMALKHFASDLVSHGSLDTHHKLHSYKHGTSWVSTLQSVSLSGCWLQATSFTFLIQIFKKFENFSIMCQHLESALKCIKMSTNKPMIGLVVLWDSL